MGLENSKAGSKSATNKDSNTSNTYPQLDTAPAGYIGDY